MPAPSVIDKLLRRTLTAGHSLLRASRLGRPATGGVHAVARTPAGRVILVKLRYAPGWRLPGGGRTADEDLEAAALRELREEIGMTAHGVVRVANGLVIVEGVHYRPRRWSWEVEAVCEAPLDRLPPTLSPRARRWLDRL